MSALAENHYLCGGYHQYIESVLPNALNTLQCTDDPPMYYIATSALHTRYTGRSDNGQHSGGLSRVLLRTIMIFQRRSLKSHSPCIETPFVLKLICAEQFHCTHNGPLHLSYPSLRPHLS